MKLRIIFTLLLTIQTHLCFCANYIWDNSSTFSDDLCDLSNWKGVSTGFPPGSFTNPADVFDLDGYAAKILSPATIGNVRFFSGKSGASISFDPSSPTTLTIETDSAYLSVNQLFDLANLTINFSGGTVKYSNSLRQTVISATYSNIQLVNGQKTISNNTIINGSLTESSGAEIYLKGTITFGSSMTMSVQSSTRFIVTTSSTSYINDNRTGTNRVFQGIWRIVSKGPYLNSGTYDNLEIFNDINAPTSANATQITITGDLNLSHFPGGTDTLYFAQGDGSTLTISGTLTNNNGNKGVRFTDINNGSTIIFNGNYNYDFYVGQPIKVNNGNKFKSIQFTNSTSAKVLTLYNSISISNQLDLGINRLVIQNNRLTFTNTNSARSQNPTISISSGSIDASDSRSHIWIANSINNNGFSFPSNSILSGNIRQLSIQFIKGGTVSLNQNITVLGNIDFYNLNNSTSTMPDDDILNINGYLLTIIGAPRYSNSGSTPTATPSSNAYRAKFRGSIASNLDCQSTTTLYFDQSSNTNSTLGTLTISNSATVTLGNNLILASGLELGTSTLLVGANTLTFSGTSTQPISRTTGTIDPTNSTIKYAQTSTNGNNTLPLAAYSSNIYNLTVDFVNGGTLTPSGDMTIGGTLNLSGTNNTFVLNGTTLTVSGSVTSTGGKFKGSSTSSLYCSGTSSLYFDQTTAATKTLKNLKIQGNNAAVTLANALEITAGTNYGSVEVTAASSTLTTGNNLTLKSDANGTARIANSPGTISGRYYAELYFPAKREYRFISAPVVGATALQWRNNGSTAGSSTSGVGIIISGTNGATDSFDATTSNKPSAFYYDEPSAGSVTNINSTGTDDPGWKAITKGGHYQLTNGKGYRVLIRGDRNVSLTTSNPTANPTTITSYGSYPRTSGSGVTINVTNSASTEMFNGLNLIGNPYPSAIDWNTISRTNVDSGYTVYNFNKGSYDAWNGTTGDAGRYISAGQAVFVWCNNSTVKTGSLTINESDKYDGKGGSYFLEKLTNHLKINLMYDSVYNSNTFLHFRPDALDSKDAFDIPQFLSNGTNIATLDPTGKAYKINSMLNLDSFTSIPLSVAQTPAANLKLSFFDVQSFDGYKLELVDNYKQTKTAITEGMIYNFEITSDSMSQKNGRFYINFTRQAGLNNKIIQNTKIAEIYPNPVDTKLNIKLDSKYSDCSYVVYNNVGQKINQGNFNKTTEKSIATKNYAKGIYYIVLKSSNTSQTIQFIK